MDCTTDNECAAATGTLELGAPQLITCNVTDLSGLFNVTAYIQDPDGTVIDTLLMTQWSATGYFAIWVNTSANENTHYIDIRAVDASSNRNEDTINSLLIEKKDAEMKLKRSAGAYASERKRNEKELFRTKDHLNSVEEEIKQICGDICRLQLLQN